jgi:hypothetical protein
MLGERGILSLPWPGAEAVTIRAAARLVAAAARAAGIPANAERKPLSEDRARLAEELRRIRETVRDRVLEGPNPAASLPEPLATRAPDVPALAEVPPRPQPPQRPDGGPVNALWEARPGPQTGGLRGWLTRGLLRLLEPRLLAQVAFNSRQVQLDNEILAYIDARFAETHGHYDAVLGIHGRHMGEIDERHLILQEELVAHVHDLVKRIDLVLAESEKGRLSLEFALRDLRSRLARLEEQLGRG